MSIIVGAKKWLTMVVTPLVCLSAGLGIFLALHKPTPPDPPETCKDGAVIAAGYSLIHCDSNSSLVVSHIWDNGTALITCKCKPGFEP